jgi:hypothetical protein
VLGLVPWDTIEDETREFTEFETYSTIAEGV